MCWPVALCLLLLFCLRAPYNEFFVVVFIRNFFIRARDFSFFCWNERLLSEWQWFSFGLRAVHLSLYWFQFLSYSFFLFGCFRTIYIINYRYYGKRLFSWLCTGHFAFCDWINEGEQLNWQASNSIMQNKICLKFTCKFFIICTRRGTRQDPPRKVSTLHCEAARTRTRQRTLCGWHH